MNDLYVKGLKGLAQRIEDADEEPMLIGRDAAPAILSLIASHEQQAARIAELESKRPAVDLSWLTRYAMIGTLMNSHPSGAYYRVEEVQSLLASPARDVGGLTRHRIDQLWVDSGSQIAGGNARYEFARAIEREVLATKETEPVQEFDADVESLKEQSEAWFAVCDVLHEVRSGWNQNGLCGMDSAVATIRALATSPAPSVKQEASEPTFNSLGIADHWAVEVHACGRQILCIESECYGGVADIEQYTETIKCCATHLLAFIGAPSASQGEVGGWISVEDRLPTDGERVAVLLNNGEVKAAEAETEQAFNEMRGIYFRVNGQQLNPLDLACVEYWIPLPAAPAPSVTDGEGK